MAANPPMHWAIINNNLSSTIGKTSNKRAYGFTPWRPLDLLAALPTPHALAARADATEAISFTLLNQKVATIVATSRCS